MSGLQELLLTILSQTRSAWRFRWYGVVAAWALAAAGLGWVVSQPDIYESTARVYIDTSSVLRPLLSNQIVPPDFATQLLYVRQALLGREYLERIAAENGLDSAAITAADREIMLNRLRSRIVVDATPANRDNMSPGNTSTIFSLSFRHEQPEVAVGVVRTLLDALVEDTLGANRQGTETAQRFLDERIVEYESRLQQAEQALAEFQKANSGRLPGSEGSYFERMQAERESLEQTRRSIRLAESRRERLREQLTSESPVMVAEANATREPPPNSLDARIRDHRAQLDRLLLEYTDRHPDVIAVREALARLEEQRTAQLRALGLSDSEQQLTALGSNPVFQALQIAMNEVSVEIATLQADADDRQRRLAELQGLIDEVPEVEAELARLNRDYRVVYEQYQQLIQSRETQRLSQHASDTEQVEFRILNPPQVGTRPVAPPRLLLLAAVLGAALAAGAGLCYGLAQIKPVFCSARALRDVSGLPVLGSVSRVVLSPQAQLRQRLAVASFSLAVTALVVTFAGIAAYEVVGPGLRLLLTTRA